MTNRKSRVPMQVSPAFEKKIKKLQSEIMKKQGENISLRDLTEKLIHTPQFENIEKAILDVANLEIKINFDRRK